MGDLRDRAIEIYQESMKLDKDKGRYKFREKELIQIPLVDRHIVRSYLHNIVKQKRDICHAREAACLPRRT